MLTYPDKPRPGDRVAVVSPSSGLPEIFPHPYELGLRRLEEHFDLAPLEYPTTRRMGASPQERAADLHAAFADPTVRAIITSIGGDDQITVVPHLDAALIRANPKPFFGFSDNTNLLVHLNELGMVAYHGGSVMTSFGRGGRMHPVTTQSLRAALFTTGEYELPEPLAHSEVDLDWADPASGATEPTMAENSGWHWHNADRVVEGAAWGGCLEVLGWMLMAGRADGLPARTHGGVLMLETSEEMPSATAVFRTLRNFGERGLLGTFAAVLVGRPKAWSLTRRTSIPERIVYRQEQRAAILRAVAQYNPDVPIVFDVDFGHTDPQVVLPMGGLVRVDGVRRRITVRY